MAIHNGNGTWVECTFHGEACTGDLTDRHSFVIADAPWWSERRAEMALADAEERRERAELEWLAGELRAQATSL